MRAERRGRHAHLRPGAAITGDGDLGYSSPGAVQAIRINANTPRLGAVANLTNGIAVGRAVPGTVNITIFDGFGNNQGANPANPTLTA